jgi:hypothetical protein
LQSHFIEYFSFFGFQKPNLRRLDLLLILLFDFGTIPSLLGRDRKRGEGQETGTGPVVDKMGTFGIVIQCPEQPATLPEEWSTT